MPATSFEPLYTRIKELLVDGEGAYRALAEANRFKEGYYDGQDLAESSVQAHEKKRYYAQIVSIEPRNTETIGDLATSAIYVCEIELLLSYFVDDPALPALWREACAAADDDVMRLRGLLGWPGNVAETEGSVTTGVIDGCLIFNGWSKGKPDPNRRSLVATMRFTAYVSLTFG